MIQHYCKIAFRNILKYKIQSIISIIGLAVGFTCFALSNLWIHYEITYDKFYEGVERTHLLYQEATLVNQHSAHTVHICRLLHFGKNFRK